MSVDAMIAKCEIFLGTVGRPNEATRWYAGRNGAYFADAAWCDMFITWAAHSSGNYDAVCLGKDYAYTVWHAQAFQAAGRWHQGTEGVRRGDIVFFDWGGSNSIAHIDHVGIVTDVNGRDILTIEGNSGDRCARRVRNADTIAGYGRPAYREPTSGLKQTWEYTVVKGDTLIKIGERYGIDWRGVAELNGIREPYAIEPGDMLRLPGRAPVTTPPTPAVPEVSLANLEYGDRSDDVKDFQAALKAKGHDPGPVDGVYGPLTKAACAAFQRAQGWSGEGANGLPGPLTVAKLGLKLVGGTAAPPAPGEPAHVYTKTTYGGKRVNQRTKVMLEAAAADFGQAFTLTQGSYNAGGVAASAGTHDGGGVVDISVSGWSRAKMDRAVQALRRAGLAAWLRTPAQGFSYHIHAVAIGDRELSPAAKSQIAQWSRDRDGLAAQGPDPAPDPYPAWTAKYR